MTVRVRRTFSFPEFFHVQARTLTQTRIHSTGFLPLSYCALLDPRASEERAPLGKISAARLYESRKLFCLFICLQPERVSFCRFFCIERKKSVQRPLNLSTRRFQTKGRGLGFGSAL